jgi:hypothetical protein
MSALLILPAHQPIQKKFRKRSRLVSTPGPIVIGPQKEATVHRKLLSFISIWILALGSAQTAYADAVTRWNANAGKAAVAACISPSLDPLHESRMYAMMHIAIHDALNAIDRRFRPYGVDLDLAPSASEEAAVAAAARDTLTVVISQIPFPPECLAAATASVEADYAAALAPIPAGPAKTAGIAIGQAAAAAIVALRTGDGSDTPLVVFDYEPGTAPGEYRFTPGNNFVFAPGWGDVTPFALQHGAQFRPGPPYSVTSKKYAADFNEIKALGGDGVNTASNRTADQTQIALFWLESSPLAWNRIARSVTASRGLDLWENARLFALLNIAMADGYIGSWEAKYHYRFWRPVTAIQTADSDGNPDTDADPNWTPLQPTYPMPDHDSGHAVQGGAAAEVMMQVFGADAIGFEACSLSLPGGSTCEDATPAVRTFASFSEAADENAVSRILVGIHFRLAVEDGVEHGRKIAARAVGLFLNPAR